MKSEINYFRTWDEKLQSNTNLSCFKSIGYKILQIVVFAGVQGKKKMSDQFVKQRVAIQENIEMQDSFIVSEQL